MSVVDTGVDVGAVEVAGKSAFTGEVVVVVDVSAVVVGTGVDGFSVVFSDSSGTDITLFSRRL
jgi:hypothetical protein